MLIGRGVDFNGDGENDMFLVTSHIPRSKEEAKQRQAAALFVGGGLVVVMLMYGAVALIAGLFIGLAELFSPEMRQYWGSKDFVSDMGWFGLILACLGLLCYRRQIVYALRKGITNVVAAPRRAVSWALSGHSAGGEAGIWVRRGNMIKGPVAPEVVLDSLRQGKLVGSDLIAPTKTGPWRPLSGEAATKCL
jgi:hypothetical protein